MKKPVVSILTLAYNQEKTILNAIEGVLSQKVTFKIEHIILDDSSTDSTEEVVNSSCLNGNSILRYIRNDKNIGPSNNGLKGLNLCNGKYIAFCEGDDYWIDENKLQKQVDFLDQNPQYGGVSTNNRWFIEKENRFQDSIAAEGEITFEELSQSNTINSQTILFRRELIDKIDWLKTLKIGDWALHLLVTSQQPYYRLPDITTVYRVHEGGVHSLLKEEFKIRNRIEVLITILKHVDLTLKRKELVKASIRDLLKKLMNYNSKDLKTTRNKYFEYGGVFFNKTIFKSYIHELF
jgi:glycosyltransferase involved in cell wall biosynthesis